MKIVFYAAPMSSAVPVATILAELEVPHEKVMFDLSKRDHKAPAFLRLNPNGKVPTLTVDGAPLFEALAITQWLGDSFGVERGMWPKPGASKERLAALSWTTWTYVQFGPAVYRLHAATRDAQLKELHSPMIVEHLQSELHHLLRLLDGHLEGKSFMLGDKFSLADLVVANTVTWGEFVGVPVAAHHNVKTLVDEVRARPSMRAEWGG